MPVPEPLPHPQHLFHMLDTGRLSREDFRAAMALHAKEVIAEMEEDHSNPVVAYFERVLNRRAVHKLTRKHGETLIREVLLALAEVPDFPPARWLWNAAHPHVPLHCFFRSRKEPLFRIHEMEALPQVVNLEIEHGSTQDNTLVHELFKLRRDRRGRLLMEVRRQKPPQS